MSEPDPMLVTGTGFAGGVTTPEDYAELHDAARDAAAGIIAATVEELGLTGAEQRVLTGSPGPALCELADEVDADAIVIGTRGSSGLRRAVMGSVSDHVVRRAPCPVVVTSPAGLADDDD
jgi:nucleotide-binding universal stress UspA family protein